MNLAILSCTAWIYNENADALLIWQNILCCSLFYSMKALSLATKSSKFTFNMLGISHVNSTCRNDRPIAVSVILDNIRIITVFLIRYKISSLMSPHEILMYMLS